MISQNLVPGGVVTTQNMSTVIRPKGNNNSLQFVKIQTPELSKTADEQIRLAEETNISKEKIKEVEEEWQNNLLNWKSKRRQQITQTLEHEPNNPFETSDSSGGRKIKTFAEMIEQRAKSGNRLGFHLQRYLGEEDEEERILAVKEETKDDDFISCRDANQSKSRIDSDYEAHSSTSSGYNQHDSKSPSSPETSLEATKTTDESASTNSKLHILRCDSEKRALTAEELDINPLSLEDNMQTQLNSTPKKVEQDEINQVKIITEAEQSDVETQGLRIHARSEDESDNSGYEEEEEEEQEEEEQKHLQRIAFEAKLKAFEKLTKPTIQKIPEIIPKRVVKLPPPVIPNRQNKMQSVEFDFKEQNPLANKKLHSPHQTQYQQEQLVQPPQKRVNQTSPRSDDTSYNNLASIKPLIKECNLKSYSNSSNVSLSSSGTKKEELTNPSHSLDALPKDQAPPPPPPLPFPETHSAIKSHQPLMMVPPQAPIIQSSSSNSSVIPPIRPTTSMVQPPLPPIDILAPPTQFSKSPTDPPIMKTQSAMLSTRPTNLRPSQDIPFQSTILPSSPAAHSLSPRPRNISQPQQPMPEPPKGAINQKKTIRDEKDRTVLSVSGKKRCSSCKEELGRGAAAFVVESLSLVYHTNCFRCSVCHVNLSNGFTGVDVRVHNGSLHCQNCYSKDGLNYSRV